MFIDVIWKCVLVLLALIFKSHAFWWQTTTTESPAASVQHIPLTYYRTYTYQPLTGGPFTFPYGFGGSAAQTPILNGARYDQYNFPPNQHFSGGPLYSAQRPYAAQQQQQSTTTRAPTTTPKTTTSTTTTTTTPAPTTTTTTSTTTTTTSPSPAPAQREYIEPLINSGGGTYGPVSHYESSIYPTYNRRNYISNYNERNYYRPSYPYPDYATGTRASALFNNPTLRHSQNVQFVPCMCPVSVGVPSGMPIVGSATTRFTLSNPVRNIYMPQSRSNDANAESDIVDMELPLDEKQYEVSKTEDNNDDDDEDNDNDNGDDGEHLNDDTIFSDDIQSTILGTNKIDSNYRKPVIDDATKEIRT